jgi:hypothetical protein
MPSERHEALIDRLCGDGWTRGRGWVDAFLARVAEEPFCGDDGIDAEEIALGFRGVRVTPDAYRLTVEGEPEGWHHPVLVLEVAEIVVSHDVPPGKLDQYEDLWWVCDTSEYTHFRLHVANRYGEMRCVLDDYPVASG